MGEGAGIDIMGAVVVAAAANVVDRWHCWIRGWNSSSVVGLGVGVGLENGAAIFVDEVWGRHKMGGPSTGARAFEF